MESCHVCGAERDPRDPAGWAGAHERDPDGRDRWICPDCTRRHARAIEAKLPSEWW
jgi:hypothetical protein